MEFIEMKPTWRGLLPVLVEVAVRGTSSVGRKDAMDELHAIALAKEEAA